jgi:hypothetical protein
MIKADSKYKIEDAVRHGPLLKYPWNTMKVGESFQYTATSNSIAAVSNRRYAPKRFSQRKMKDGTCRVFRIE